MLTAYEQETIINFNKGDDMATIFTYEKTWQSHIESRFGIEPVEVNGFGGKTYVIPKSRIRKPVPRKSLSAEQVEELRLRGRVLAAKRAAVKGVADH